MDKNSNYNSKKHTGAALFIKAAFICVLVAFLASVYMMNDAKDVPM